MNIKYWLFRLIGRPTCKVKGGVRIYRSASIINTGGRSDLITIGANCVVKGELFVFPNGDGIHIGNWCYVGEGTRIWSAAGIRIGDRVLISHNVNIFDSLTHPLSAQERHRQFVQIMTVGHPEEIDLGSRRVHIEDDALIGASTSILRGVHIGRGAIVGTGSVVTADVPPWTVVAGNPARIIREIPIHER